MAWLPSRVSRARKQVGAVHKMVRDIVILAVLYSVTSLLIAVLNTVLFWNQAANLKVCGVDPELVETLKRFRFRKGKNCAAIVGESIIQTLARAPCNSTEFYQSREATIILSHIVSASALGNGLGNRPLVSWKFLVSCTSPIPPNPPHAPPFLLLVKWNSQWGTLNMNSRA